MKTTFILYLVLLILIGCKGEQGVEGPAGPSLKGNIYGFVVLYDSLGKKLMDNSGVQVVIDGTTFITSSDSSGRWIFKDLTTGIYSFTLSKSGYALGKLNYSFVGGGEAFLYKVYLGKLPTFQITSLTTSAWAANKSAEVVGSVASLNTENVVLFFNKSLPVTSEPTNNIGYLYSYTTISGTNNSFLRVVYSWDFDNMGLISGDKIYVRAYPDAKEGRYSYTDPITGRLIFTSLGTIPSKIDSLIVP